MDGSARQGGLLSGKITVQNNGRKHWKGPIECRPKYVFRYPNSIQVCP